MNRFHALLVEEARANRRYYDVGADALEGPPRKGVARQIVGARRRRDFRAFDLEHMDAQAIGRDRLYYLMLALCGLPFESTGVRYQEELRAAVTDQQEVYSELYELFCRSSGRDFVDGLERRSARINAYLEGVIVHGRFDAEPSPEEIVDTVLRLFLVTTKPKGGIDIDVDEGLLPRPHPDPGGPPTEPQPRISS